MLLTTSEARAEACTVLLRLVLKRMPASELRRLHAEAYSEATRIGAAAVMDEVEWLFHGVNL